MGPSSEIAIFMACVLYVVMMSGSVVLVEGQQQVPCLFFMGDSAFDNGNNNLLVALAKVNYSPYGTDFPDGPTGRFTNGRNTPDFIAEFLGFEKHIPPFTKAASGSEILKGVNYASGAAGILDDTGGAQGGRITMNKQLINHGIVVSKMALLLGDARSHLNKCLYVVNIGSNDYANNYLMPLSYPQTASYTTQQFATKLIQRYSQQLKTLYNYGARKIAIYSLGQVGCAPFELASNPPTNGSSCTDSFASTVVQPFNDKLKPLIDTLNTNLPDAQFILINATTVSLSDTSVLGSATKTSTPCCVTLKLNGLCVPGSSPCNNRTEYLFWDQFHPTEYFIGLLATRAYSAESPSDVYPMDIRSLVQQ